jgi:hypothetical protein
MLKSGIIYSFPMIEALWGAFACADIDACLIYFFASLQFAIHAVVLHLTTSSKMPIIDYNAFRSRTSPNRTCHSHRNLVIDICYVTATPASSIPLVVLALPFRFISPLRLYLTWTRFRAFFPQIPHKFLITDVVKSTYIEPYSYISQPLYLLHSRFILLYVILPFNPVDFGCCTPALHQ